jgi:hypothetical protein
VIWGGRDVTVAARGSWHTTETARVARAAFPKTAFCMRLRDALGPLFTDEAFAGLFSGRGRPAELPGTLALVVDLTTARIQRRPILGQLINEYTQAA